MIKGEIMKLMRCERGHFYDAEKYDICPHCTDVKEVKVPLPSDLSLFKVQDVLGESQTSKVFRMTPKRHYAVKVVDIADSKVESAVDNEYRIAQQLDDRKYFINYYAMYKQDGKVCIVQPELRNLLTYIEDEHPSLRSLLKITEDIAQAIMSLQEKKNCTSGC